MVEQLTGNPVQTQQSIGHRKRIGELLIEAEILRREELPIGLKEAERRDLRLGEVLVMLRYLSAEDLENVLQAQTLLNSGAIREGEAVHALKYASSHRIAFEEGLRIAKQDADDKKSQSEMELSILLGRAQDMERTRGPHDRDLATTWMLIAQKNIEFEDVKAAEENYRRALKIFERAYGPRHLKVAACQSKLVEVLFEQERYKEAESACWRVLDIVQDAWSDGHVQVAKTHTQMARLLEAQYRFREAEQFYISALRITEHVCGPDSAQATDLLRLLSAFWPKQGKKPEHHRLGDLLVEAGLLKPEELKTALTLCATDNVPLGQALVRLNHLTQDQLRPALQAQILIGDGVLPVQLATRALRMGRQGQTFEDALRDLGWEPDTFTTEELNVLIDAAEELISAEAALGCDHAGVAVLSMKLADMYTTQERFNEAEPLYQRACAILEKSFGGRDPELATALAKLAHLYLTDNRPQSAEPVLSRALAIRRSAHGEKHMDVAECMELLGITYDKLGNAAQAEELYRSALSVKAEMLGVAAERTAETEERLAGTLLAQQKAELAEPLFKKLLEQKEQRQGKTSPGVAVLLQHLGEVYMLKQQQQLAETHFRRALEIHEKNDKSSLAAADLMEKFSFLLETTGRIEESRKMKEQAQNAKRLRT